MQPSILFSTPYDQLVAPLLPVLVSLLIGFCIAGVTADLTAPADRPRGRLATLCVILLLVTIGRAWFAFDSWASTGTMLAAFAVLIAYAAHFGWLPAPGDDARRSPTWIGAAIILVSFAIKCLALEQWPANLNTYSAMTGEEGLRAIEGEWPSSLLAIRAYPLAEGGKSPLHLPILFASMKAFGGTVFAVRFAEVIGSTLLLVMLWLWVRHVLPGSWSAIALAVFAFSPWHLMQSRFGTYYSLCAGLALAILWAADAACQSRGGRGAWAVLGACTAAVSWAYAPLQVLYPFVIAVLIAGLFRKGHRAGPLIAVAVFAAIVVVQLSQGGREAFMRSDFGQLATDTVIWRKDAADNVTRTTQPLAVIADHFAHNVQRWFADAFRERDILVWWAPALGVGLLYAVFELRRSATWIRSAYYLIGLLPPLLIFPLHRRTLIVWPLVYVAGVRFCREIVAAAAQVRGRSTGGVAALVVGAALFCTSLDGLRSYAVGNPAGLVYPYFGPPHRHLMIDEAKRLLPDYHLLFVTPGILKHPINVGLYETARRLPYRRAYELIEKKPDHVDFQAELRAGRKNCFIYLNDEQHAWVADELRAQLPGGTLVERRGSNPIGPPLYSLYFFPEK